MLWFDEIFGHLPAPLHSTRLNGKERMDGGTLSFDAIAGGPPIPPMLCTRLDGAARVAGGRGRGALLFDMIFGGILVPHLQCTGIDWPKTCRGAHVVVLKRSLPLQLPLAFSVPAKRLGGCARYRLR